MYLYNTLYIYVYTYTAGENFVLCKLYAHAKRQKETVSQD